MLPTLAEGDYVIAFRWWWTLKEGDLVIARHPLLPFLIKRIKSIDEHGDILLQGDSKESLSTEQMGTVPRKQIIGKVIYLSRAKHY